MLTLSAKKLNSLIDSPKSNSKEKLKPITRKPETTSFSRKNNQQILMAESISITRAPSRDKNKAHLEKIIACKSLKQMKPPNGPDIKYLSPKHIKEARAISEVLLIQSEKSPRFTRTNNLSSKNPANLSFISKASDRDNDMMTTPQISQISLQSVLNKKTSETQPHTDDWSALERENYHLKQQNLRLRQENDDVMRRIGQLSKQSVCRQPVNKKSTISQRCKNCLLLQEKIKIQIKYIALHESTISEKQKEIEKLRREVLDRSCEAERERQKYLDLHRQFRTITTKYLEEEKVKMELANIIDSLNAKLQHHEQQMRYFSIQENMLLKKKQENEQWKAEAARLTVEKKSLMELISTYRARIDVIRNINQKKKLSKSKSHKQIYYEDLFELSSQQSDRDL